LGWGKIGGLRGNFDPTGGGGGGKKKNWGKKHFGGVVEIWRSESNQKGFPFRIGTKGRGGGRSPEQDRGITLRCLGGKKGCKKGEGKLGVALFLFMSVCIKNMKKRERRLGSGQGIQLWHEGGKKKKKCWGEGGNKGVGDKTTPQTVCCHEKVGEGFARD